MSVPMTAREHSDNFLKGILGKDIVKFMLERSGYTVFSYGYEDNLLDAKSKRTTQTSNSNTGRRLRRSPDLLVYDDKDIMLVEVKTRGNPRPYIRGEEIGELKEFWNDSILVLVIPDDNVFYAKRTQEFEAEKYQAMSNIYFKLSEFKKFEDVFTRVSSVDISYYRHIVSQILNIFIPKNNSQ